MIFPSAIRTTRRAVAAMPLSWVMRMTVLENVELPLIYQGIDPIDRRELAMEALGRVGLADRA